MIAPFRVMSTLCVLLPCISRRVGGLQGGSSLKQRRYVGGNEYVVQDFGCHCRAGIIIVDKCRADSHAQAAYRKCTTVQHLSPQAYRTSIILEEHQNCLESH